MIKSIFIFKKFCWWLFPTMSSNTTYYVLFTLFSFQNKFISLPKLLHFILLSNFNSLLYTVTLLLYNKCIFIYSQIWSQHPNTIQTRYHPSPNFNNSSQTQKHERFNNDTRPTFNLAKETGLSKARNCICEDSSPSKYSSSACSTV